jgi:hypothetical protein
VRTIEIAAAASALALAACGGGTMGSSQEASALAGYQALGQQMTTTIATYGAQTATLPDVATCQGAQAQYQGAMPGMVDRMQQMSGAMDHHMADMGQAGFDMKCVADAMAAELQHHHMAACTSPDVAVDEQEAGDHVATMNQLMQHQRMRYQDAGSSMGMMDPPGGTTFTCQENGDGSYTMGGQRWTPGMPVPGAGTCTGDACTQPWPPPCMGMMCGGGGMGMH